MSIKKILIFPILGLILLSTSGKTESVIQPEDSSRYHEELLINVIDKIKNQELESALIKIKHLVKVNPQFKLAQFIYGDLMLAKANGVIEFDGIYNIPYERIDELRREAMIRWRYHQSKIDDEKIPSSLIRMAEDQPYAIVVDLSVSRLFLFKNTNGIPKLVRDFYVSTGKNGAGKIKEGDKKTPVGIYFITNFIGSNALPDFYGDGALEINYPNIIDKRSKRTGSGIWLHGAPIGVYSRPPRDSNGCVILANQDLKYILDLIGKEKIPVILDKKITWVDVKQWKQKYWKFVAHIEQWRKAWERQDIKRYLHYYSTEYSEIEKSYKFWLDYNNQIDAMGELIDVKFSNNSIFLYPNNKSILVTTFILSNVNNDTRERFIKRQYWHMEKGKDWRILYEEDISQIG